MLLVRVAEPLTMAQCIPKLYAIVYHRLWKKLDWGGKQIG